MRERARERKCERKREVSKEREKKRERARERERLRSGRVDSPPLDSKVYPVFDTGLVLNYILFIARNS